MASREKYIFHMLFGAFHITARNQISGNHKSEFPLYVKTRTWKQAKLMTNSGCGQKLSTKLSPAVVNGEFLI